MTADENPYAAPAPVSVSVLQPVSVTVMNDDGVWSDNGLLVVVNRGSNLPARCVKCNAPTEYRLRRELSWFHPACWILAILAMVIFVIVIIATRKYAIVNLGLCNIHRARRRKAIWIAWLIVATALGCLVLAVALDINRAEVNFFLFLSGLVLFFVGVIYGSARAKVLKPHKINKYFAWLKGASPDFLAELPPV